MNKRRDPFDAAVRKGRAARHAGEPRSACPYTDFMCGRHDHIPTFSRAWRRRWFEGWDAADKELAAQAGEAGR